ncbi:MAG: aminoacyl-tRNA hydrolase [Thermodesulfobacteriota bacterium]
MGQLFVIVGLGNPGKEYERHRHNLGFMVVDEIVREAGGSWTRSREKAQVSKITIDDLPVLVAKPLTFMNLSGRAVAPIMARRGADPNRMVVIHDDLDLDPGAVRIKVGGGDGGHKGVRSIADSLRFRDFIRVRLGIGRPPIGQTPEEFVLTRFPSAEREELRELVRRGSEAVLLILREGVARAQNQVHSWRYDAPEAAPDQ